jgi:hypothetical protein
MKAVGAIYICTGILVVAAHLNLKFAFASLEYEQVLLTAF